MPSSPPAGQPDLPAPPTAAQQRPKSPPLAFAKTPNDSLAPLTSPPLRDESGHGSPSTARMGRTGRESLLESTVEQQANAINKLHVAFQAEREAWLLERRGLYDRIANLETLLKSGKHDSPAKSPVSSPSNGSVIVSPQPRAMASSQTLPTITEDENIPPLAAQHENAPPPTTTDLSTIAEGSERRRSVTFIDADGFKVEEIPPPVLPARDGVSPPPPNNVMMAGSTPPRLPRPPTPPPNNMTMDGIEDTPTRHNTALNNFLTQTVEADEEKELKGPLNMPELPNKPTEGTFTFEALTKKLEQVSKDPVIGKPGVFQRPSPGLASPADEVVKGLSQDISPGNMSLQAENPLAPVATRTSAMSQSDASSKPLSPIGGVLSPQEEHDAVHHEFEQGGIKLKKRPSVNFGLPLGSLGGFGGARRPSATG